MWAPKTKKVEKMGIHVGCVVTYEDTFMVLNKDWYVARALDNRAGGFMIAEVARLLHEGAPSCRLASPSPTRFRKRLDCAGRK